MEHIYGEHRTKKEAEEALKRFQKGDKEGTYRIVKNNCSGRLDKQFPFLIQVKDKSEPSGWMCLHEG